MILLQLFKVLCVCNTRVGQIRAGQIRVGQIRAHHCCEYTIADQPSIVLATKVSFYPEYHCCECSILNQPKDSQVPPSPKNIVLHPKVMFFGRAKVSQIRLSRVIIYSVQLIGG